MSPKGCLRPSFTPAGDPSTPRPHAFCPAPAAPLRPTLSAWASRDFKLLVTIFSSSSRSPHLLHPKQGPPGEGAGPGGQGEGGSRKSGRGEGGKKERKQVERGENSTGGEGAEPLRAGAAGTHPFIHSSCFLARTPCASLPAGPTKKKSRHGGMEERAQPAPAREGGAERSVVEAVVQRGERWLARFERQRQREGGCCASPRAPAPVPLPLRQ